MNTPFETKLDSMILQAEFELDQVKKAVIGKITSMQLELSRNLEYIQSDRWLGVLPIESAGLDAAIAGIGVLKKRLDDLKTMREVALAAIKSAKEQK